jgi:two-component system KDP operon response regulator KdpE
MMPASVREAVPALGPGAMSSEIEKPLGRILVADEDYSVRRALHTTLYAAGFDITEASGVSEAIALVQVVRCDIALMAARMGGREPVEICRELRAHCPGLPVLMLTAADNEGSQLEALDAGADDCIAKPLRMNEVMARVRAVIRRTRSPLAPSQSTIRIGEIEVNPSRRIVYKSGNIVHLTPKEFDLLLYLMMHAGIPIPHGQLLTAVWGQDHANRVDYLRTFMRQLRRKLENHDGTPRYLLTNNYIGYRFADKAELPVAD